jgi:hypothetical protein
MRGTQFARFELIPRLLPLGMADNLYSVTDSSLYPSVASAPIQATATPTQDARKPFGRREYDGRIFRQFAKDIATPGIGLMIFLLAIIASLLIRHWTTGTVLDNIVPQALVFFAYVAYNAVSAPWKVHQALQAERIERARVWRDRRAECHRIGNLYQEILRRWPDRPVAKFPYFRFNWGVENGETNIPADVQAGMEMTDALRKYLQETGNMLPNQIGSLQFLAFLTEEDRNYSARIESELSRD